MSNGGYKGASPARETSPEQYPGVWELTEQFQAQADGNWPFQADDNAPKSLRFDSYSPSGYLTRTPTAASNQRTWTWSGWVKRCISDGDWRALFTAINPDNSNRNDGIWFSGPSTGDQIYISFGDNTNIQFSPRHRDPSAWFNICVSLDTTRAADQVQCFVNGEKLSIASGSQPAQNYQGGINTAVSHSISRRDSSNSQFFDGYLSEVHFIDGQALSCEEFGFFDGQGIWQPKRFTGDYSTGPVYTNDVTGTGISSTVSKLFDGSTSTTVDGTAATVITFTPSTPIPYSSSVEVYTASSQTVRTYRLNGGSGVTNAANNWTSLATGSGTITSISQTPNSGYTHSWSAIRVDGQILTEASVGRNSFHLDFSDGVKDQSGLGNDWTGNNVAVSGDGPASSPVWESGDSGWTIASGGGSASEGGSNGYQDVFTGLMEVGKVYAFTTSHTNGDQNGGWFFADSNSTSLSGTHPNQGRGSNSIGQRGRSSGHSDENNAGAHGTFATANGVTAGDSNLSGFSVINPEGSDTINWVVDRVKNKVWVKRSTDSAWIQGGNPSDGDSSPSFHLPATGDLYFGFVQYNNSNLTISIAAYSFTASGRASDIFVDSPVNGNEVSTSAGGERRGNYATLSPIDTQLTANGTISDGNLKFVQSSTGARGGRATIGVSSGKHYWEFTHLGGNASHGIAQNSSNLGSYPGGNDADGISWFVGGNIYRNGSTSTYAGKTYAVGDVIGTALDMDAGTVTFYKNGVSQGVAATGLTGTWFPGFGSSNVSVVSFEANFGQKAFSQTPPAGYSPLATCFLPEPTIKRGDEGLDVVLWSGDNAVSRSIKTSLSPDFAWIKVRNAANTWHHITDIVRGAPNKLYPNDPAAEDTTPIYGQVDSLDTDGFTVGDGTHGSNPLADVNQTGVNYVGYAFDAGDTTTTVAAGSLDTSLIYDRSKVWTSLVTTSSLHNSYNSYGSTSKLGCFDGKRNTSMYSAGGPLTITFDASAFPASGGPYFVEVETNQRGIKVNGQPSSGYTTNIAANQATYWANNGSVASLTSVEINQANHVYGGMCNRIRVNGKVLVDPVNTSQTWSNSLTALANSSLTNPANGFNGDENDYADSTAGFTLDLSGHTFGTGSHTIELKSGGATAFTVNGTTSLSTTGSSGAIVWTGTHTGELTSLTSSATGASVYYIKIDGQYLLNPGQDFAPVLPSHPSTVRARPEVGFSIVKWDNPSASVTIAHGLSASAPDFIVTKYLGGNTDLWQTYHRSLGNNYKLYLSEPDSKVSSSMWQTEHPTRHTFNANDNTTGDWIAYCWSSVENYSKFTSFTGTGGDVFVYLGFKPRMIWFKNADASTNWLCYDTARNPFNPADFSLQLDEPNTDTTVTNDEIDILSNGFNIKATRSDLTGNGNKILVAAWAEHPFASNARAR